MLVIDLSKRLCPAASSESHGESEMPMVSICQDWSSGRASVHEVWAESRVTDQWPVHQWTGVHLQMLKSDDQRPSIQGQCPNVRDRERAGGVDRGLTKSW